MRENPDTSLKILRLLADEECYPSQLKGEDIASQLELTKDETLLHVQCCVDNGLMEPKILDTSTFGIWTAREISQIWGLTAEGQEFVHQAELWWETARKKCAKAGIEATTSTLTQMMSRLTGGDLPEEEAGGVYGPGDEFAFYRDLSILFAKASTDILIVDPYFEHQVFLNLDAVPEATSIRILLSKPDSEVTTIAEKYGKGRSGQLTLRSLSRKKIHDRVLFLDARGWVIGQSLKDVGKNQPTYFVELSEPSLTALKKSHEELWKAATVVHTS